MKISEAHEKIDEYYLDKKVRGIKLENLPTKFINLVESHKLSIDVELIEFINCLLNIEDFVKPEVMPKKWNSDRTYSMAFKVLYDILHDVEEIKTYCTQALSNEQFLNLLKMCDNKRTFYFNQYNKGRLSKNLNAVEDDRNTIVGVEINDVECEQSIEHREEDIENKENKESTTDMDIIQKINDITSIYSAQIKSRDEIISKQNLEINELKEKNCKLENNEELLTYKKLLRDFIANLTSLVLKHL